MNHSQFFILVTALIAIKEPLHTSGKDICYPEVGCFQTGLPWTSLTRLALPPQNPSKVSTYMYFYSRNTSVDGVTFPIFPEIDLTKIPLSPNNPTFFIIHGFTDSGKTPWILRLKDVLLNISDANVFVPDYSSGSGGLYTQAVGNARIMGSLGALVVKAAKIELQNVHLIGHSLGAQVASYIAKNLHENGKKIKRITALDPAGPLFQGENPIVRLNSSDANDVVALHTNAGLLGMLTPHGDVDFYFNGGTEQPGCTPVKITPDGTYDWTSCSHQRAHEYFIEAVNATNCIMWGRPQKIVNIGGGLINGVVKGLIPNLPQRGETCEKSDEKCLSVGLNTIGSGIYQVGTQANSPFCVSEVKASSA